MYPNEKTKNDAMKENAIALAKHHKRSCKNPHCVISIFLLGELLTKAGITMTKEESQVFI